MLTNCHTDCKYFGGQSHQTTGKYVESKRSQVWLHRYPSRTWDQRGHGNSHSLKLSTKLILHRPTRLAEIDGGFTRTNFLSTSSSKTIHLLPSHRISMPPTQRFKLCVSKCLIQSLKHGPTTHQERSSQPLEIRTKLFDWSDFSMPSQSCVQHTPSGTSCGSSTLVVFVDPLMLMSRSHTLESQTWNTAVGFLKFNQPALVAQPSQRSPHRASHTICRRMDLKPSQAGSTTSPWSVTNSSWRLCMDRWRSSTGDSPNARDSGRRWLRQWWNWESTILRTEQCKSLIFHLGVHR